MKSKRVKHEQQRLIEILQRNPGRYSMEGLKGLVHICIATIKDTIVKNKLQDLLRPRKKGSKKKNKKGGSGFFEYNRLDDIY